MGQIDALYRMADAVARATSLEELFDEAVETLIEATGAARGAVLLYDDDNVMRFRVSTGLSESRQRAITLTSYSSVRARSLGNVRSGSRPGS